MPFLLEKLNENHSFFSVNIVHCKNAIFGKFKACDHYITNDQLI